MPRTKKIEEVSGTGETAKVRVNLSAMVNSSKVERAMKAVEGKGKPGSTEVALVAKFRAEGLKGDELVLAVYQGLGGLLDSNKAIINRKNEAKEKARKASR